MLYKLKIYLLLQKQISYRFLFNRWNSRLRCNVPPLNSRFLDSHHGRINRSDGRVAGGLQDYYYLSKLILTTSTSLYPLNVITLLDITSYYCKKKFSLFLVIPSELFSLHNNLILVPDISLILYHQHFPRKPPSASF